MTIISCTGDGDTEREENRKMLRTVEQKLKDERVGVEEEESEEEKEEVNPDSKHYDYAYMPLRTLEQKHQFRPPIPLPSQINLQDERVEVEKEAEEEDKKGKEVDPDWMTYDLYILDDTNGSVTSGDFRDVTACTVEPLPVQGESEGLYYEENNVTNESLASGDFRDVTPSYTVEPLPVQGETEEIYYEPCAPPLPIRNKGRRHRYEETIMHNRPIIVRDVIVSQVLPYLHMCLGSSDISAIKGENDQHKAVELLLDKLSACKEPGKWKMFVQALEECGHKAIVDALRRKSIPDSNEPRKFLHIFSPRLREMIVPSETTAELLAADVINSEDRDEIHQKERSAGAVAAADILLDRIPRKHPDWFGNFISALRIIGRHDLVDMITEGNDIQSCTANPEEEDSVSSNERTDTTKCKSTLKYGSPVLGNEQQATNESAECYVNKESKNLEYSEAYEDFNEKKEKVECKNVQSLRDKKNALVAEGKVLELEMPEFEDILNAFEKNNELLRRKRSFYEKIKIKEKEATALKAAISGEDIEEDKFRYQSAASLEDMVQNIAPGRCLMTLDFRDTDRTSTVIPSRIPIDTGIAAPVKLYDVGQFYKDSAFYEIYES
ncbi:uncharacterized protein LOC128556902 [Mercenaria mercenaria]|uniref:uncharacterized protein LOC128556902 n=1 Tax=Mercenaria mercenaria TaxID=6596 RepID=UPI00234E6BF1|nr:uncharacterized protein LOC128556902 [Mercenaria mercenaria]